MALALYPCSKNYSWGYILPPWLKYFGNVPFFQGSTILCTVSFIRGTTILDDVPFFQGKFMEPNYLKDDIDVFTCAMI